MVYLQSSYDTWAVTLSVLIATFASYVALDLTRRVRREDPDLAKRWVIGGALVMGTGIWSMHFMGMHAFTLPIAIGYGKSLTFLSWAAACATSALALSIAGVDELTRRRWIGGSLGMGLGICAMHYTGMGAIDLAPGIVWDWLLVGASALIAVSASAVALYIFFWLRKVDGYSRVFRQCLAASLMGLAISGMHYTAMAAANFPVGSICLSAGTLGDERVIELIVMTSVLILACALLASIVDSRVQRNAVLLADSLAKARVRLESADGELRQRALLDELTRLPNRVGFENRLALSLERVGHVGHSAGRLAQKVAVLFIDIDGFKPVNESLGHAGSDAVICEVARRICGRTRDGDTVARLGGDQFLVLMDGVQAVGECVDLAVRVLEAVKVPFHVAERRVQVSVSIGIVVYPDHGESDLLLARADTAMQAAKRAGRGAYAVFEPHMHKGAADQLDLIGDLRQAIDRGELELHYQPKIDGLRGVICGVEALLRWTHPTRGSVSPGVFIPIAERFGFINTLGDWVIEEACRQMQRWDEAGVQMRVAINLSVHQLGEVELVSRISAAMERHGVKSSHLLCEITESVAMQDIEVTQRTLEGLGRIGVYLSIDDFGTGYSSLSYLRQLPARQLKIDRSFIKDLGNSNHARAVVDAVVRLSHALGLRVVAEGVETARQRDILLELGCDELQGYFFAHPMPADSLLEWAAGRKPKGTVDFAKSLIHESIGA